MTAFPRLSTTTLGQHNNAPRVWLEGTYLLDAGFTPARRVEVEFHAGRVVIRPSVNGPRVVSSKKQGRIPVLDLNSAALRAAFGNVSLLQVRLTDEEIILTPVQTEELRRSRCRNGKEGSVFCGGGLLTEAARQAGFEPAFAIEANADYAAVFSLNHPTARMYNMSIEDVPLTSLPAVELLTIGLPCEPFSNARTRDRITGAKRDRSLPPEAHPLADLSLWAAMLVRHVNAATVVIEEAPGYLTSGAGFMMRLFLERAGYFVHAEVLDPLEFGELTGRKRTVIVATSEPGFHWPSRIHSTRTFADIADPAEKVEHDYFTAATKSWLVQHWAAQTAKGNGFVSVQLTGESKTVPCVSKRYFSQQGTGVVVRHPERDQCWRWLTISEVRRLHGVPDSYNLKEDESKTRAGEILGQGVIVTFFKRIIAATRSLSGYSTASSTLPSAGIAPSTNQLGLAFA